MAHKGGGPIHRFTNDEIKSPGTILDPDGFKDWEGDLDEAISDGAKLAEQIWKRRGKVFTIGKKLLPEDKDEEKGGTVHNA